MISEMIRRYGFWFVDALGGGHVRQYVADLEKKLQGDLDTSSDDLRKLLDHAVNTTEFYGKFKGYSKITDFPVIKKSLIKGKYNQFISSDYKNKRLYRVQTSGSTGERFVMLQDKQKRKRVIAELIYFLEQSGFRLGYRHIYARVWHRDNQKTKLMFMMHNTIMFDCSFLSDESLDKLYQMLRKDNSIKCITGYADSLAAVAFYFDKKGYTSDMFNIKIIVSGAERLEPNTKALLKKVFGCTVISRYANIENGFLAQQPNDGDNFILNTAHYFFEMLKLDSDDPAPCGEPARLVVTDLYNYAMPLIRYNTEDIVITGMPEMNFPGKKVLMDVSGRCDEIIYDTCGNKICPHFIAVYLRRYEQLPQFQLVQDSLKHFILKLEGVRDIYDNNDFQHTIRQIVGADAVVKIEHVDKIPHLSSGKFKKIICNYKVDS